LRNGDSFDPFDRLRINRLRTGNRDFLVLTEVEKEFRIWVPDRESSKQQSRIFAALRG
jgi:hypothetical protein